MVGLYPDLPGPRLAYDRDGTALVKLDGSNANPIMLANSNLITMNNESGDYYQMDYNSAIAFVFPTLRDITKLMIAEAQSGYRNPGLQKSTNTTNGSDGTWNNVGSGALSAVYSGDPNIMLRTQSFQDLGTDCLGVKAIRFLGAGFLGVGAGPAMIALLGKPTNVSDRLDLWHPTLDQPLYNYPAHFDWGDVPRGSAAQTKTFRVKNRSSTLTASSITVGMEAKTDSAAPTVISQMELKYAGGAYGSSAAISSIGPGAISDLVTVRLTPSASATMGAWMQRYFAEAGVWS